MEGSDAGDPALAPDKSKRPERASGIRAEFLLIISCSIPFISSTFALTKHPQTRHFQYERFLRRGIELVTHFLEAPNTLENIGRF